MRLPFTIHETKVNFCVDKLFNHDYFLCNQLWSNFVKTILNIILTTTALITNSFAADSLDDNYVSESKSLELILLEALCNNDSAQIAQAIENGAKFAGSFGFFAHPTGSLIHFSASLPDVKLETFQSFLSICLKEGFDINSTNENGLTLLHIAARNSDPSFVELLISLGMHTNIAVTYSEKPLLGRIYPLFFAKIHNHDQLIPLLSQGLTDEQIMQTEAQVETCRTY
jgi:hypothetical protein